MSNKVYDLLKNIALILPLVSTFVIAICEIWNIPYSTEISLSITALNSLIAGIVKIESKRYYKNNKK